MYANQIRSRFERARNESTLLELRVIIQLGTFADLNQAVLLVIDSSEQIDIEFNTRVVP